MAINYVAKTIVINADGLCLVLRRSKQDGRSPGRIDLPGGGVEDSEAYVVSAAREIKEEAGIVVAPEQLQLVYSSTSTSSQDGTLIIRFLYLCHIGNDEVRLSFEHDAFEWLPPEEFCQQLSTTSWGEGVLCTMRQGLL